MPSRALRPPPAVIDAFVVRSGVDLRARPACPDHRGNPTCDDERLPPPVGFSGATGDLVRRAPDPRRALEDRTGVGHPVLVAVVAMLATVAVFGPPWRLEPVVVALWLLVVFCRRDAVRRRAGRGLRYHLSAVGLLYLVPIAIATTCSVLLADYVELFGDAIRIDRLVATEQFLERLSTFFSDDLKLSESGMLALLVGSYLLTCLLLRPRRTGDAPQTGGWRLRAASALGRGTDSYGRYSGPVAAGLATLASFTLFGLQAGVPATDLHLRLKVAQEGYADATSRIEAELSQRVATGVYAKVRVAFPPAYRAALDQQAEIDDPAGRVQAHAASARTSYGVTVASVEQAVSERTARGTRVDGLADTVRTEATGRAGVPGDLTPEQVDAARRTSASGRPVEGIDLVVDGHRKITLQFEKIASEQILKVTGPLTETVPIMEPLLQAFAEAADQTLQDRMGRAYDRLVDVAAHSPGGLDAALDREAADIVGRTDVDRPVERATPRAVQVAADATATRAALENGDALIDRLVGEIVAARDAAAARDARARPRDGKLLVVRPIDPLPYVPRYVEPPPSVYRYGGAREVPRYRPPEVGRATPRVAAPRPPPRLPRIFFW